jgi:glycosyltransferase involved in cell wall biosynthesis
MRRLKILVAAYACDPDRGSEMAVGWGWVTAIARSHEVWVLCADWQRQSIEAWLSRAEHDAENLHFIFVGPKPWHFDDSNWAWRLCERSILKPIFHWSYRIWQRDAHRTAEALHRTVRFDLGHQLTFVGFRFPGHLWKLGIPFVWGPIGGLENTPWRLLPAMGIGGAAYYVARNTVNAWHKRALIAPRRAFARADAVIASTSGIKAQILRWYGVPSEVISEVNAPSKIARNFKWRATGEPLRIAWSGRHLPGKALNLLLQGLARLPESVDWRLDIYGDGPSRAKWEALARKLSIAEWCAWHGHVPREEALRGICNAHLFAITSLKDLTSTVTIEALTLGVPVICPDHCGFADAISTDCGIRVPIRSLREFEEGLASAIGKLAADEDLRRRLAAGALRRAQDYSVEAKAEAIERVYAAAMERRAALLSSGKLAVRSPSRAGTEAIVDHI